MIINDNDTEIFKHTYEGYEILKQSKFFYPIADIVYSHHNRYYGSNPNNLVQHDIPLESRIIYLADRIDLAINHNEDIISQIEHIVQNIESSQHFDPQLVIAFEKIAQD